MRDIMTWKTTLLNELSTRAGQLKLAGNQASHAARVVAGRASTADAVVRGTKVARVAASNFPVKELATMCGRAGVAGAVIDGAIGSAHAAKAVRDGRLDGTGAVKHIVGEAGCGFVTSSAGTAGTVAVYMITGAMGPVTLLAGMGASMGSRYVYRKIIGETLPDKNKRESDSTDEGFEDIGPKPQD